MNASLSISTLLLVTGSLLAGCGTSSPLVCDETTCTGCCTGDGRCDPGTELDSCGSAGRACDVCIGQQACTGKCSFVSGAGGGGGGAGGSADGVGGSGSGGGGASCVPEVDAALCARIGLICGSASVSDNCGAQRSVSSCGTCTAPQTCTANSCSCSETDAVFCARMGKACGPASGVDKCGVPRSVVSCAACSAPKTCSAGQCTCTAETDAQFCTRFGKACGAVTAADNCGVMRTVTSCGTCAGTNLCSTMGVCACPETNAAFCVRMSATCGALSGTDSCGNPKSVSSCGTCAAPQTCSGGGTANKCGCTPQSNAVFCTAQAKNCGVLTANDNCNQPRTADCGACTSPLTCGGGATANVCGCTPETNAQLCARLGKNCGSVTANDNCGAPRTNSCGSTSCSNPLQTCGGGGAANVCGCPGESDAQFCTRLGKTCGSVTANDLCGISRTATCGICGGVGFTCDAVVSACVVDPLPPRIIAPLGGSLISGRPVFRWQTDPTATDSEIEICSDRFCTSVVAVLTGTTGATVAVPLSRGAWFVRGRGRTLRANLSSFRGTRFTATRVIYVTGRPVISQALLNLVPDFDGDGRPETAITDPFSPNLDIANIYFYWGNGTSSIWRGGYRHSGVADAAFASAAINAGDVDGDGLPEVVTIDDGSQNPATILRGNVQSYVAPAPLDYLVPAGDVDGDGYADVLAVDRVPYTGEIGVAVTVLFGGQLGFGRVTTFSYDIPVALRPSSTGPVSVRGLGDVNGDGFSDVAFGVSLQPNTCVGQQGPDPSYVEIRSGAAAAPLTQLLFRVDGFGSLTPLGDVDGDGFPDFGFYKPGKDCISPGVSRPDQVVVIFGGTNAPLRSSTWDLPPFTFSTCLNSSGVPATVHFQGLVVGGADLDADTFGDVALGQGGYLAYDNCYSGTVGPFPGRVFALYGSQTGQLAQGQNIVGPDGPGTFFGFNASMITTSGSSGGDRLVVRSHPFHGIGWTPAIPDRVRSYAGGRGTLVNTATYVSGAPDWSGDEFGYSFLSGL